jgi:hypothetical protein
VGQVRRLHPLIASKPHRPAAGEEGEKDPCDDHDQKPK